MNILINPSEAKQFARVVVGMEWPGEKPGWIVAIGEERDPRPGGSVRHCHLLAESGPFAKTQFLSDLSEFQAMYQPVGIYGKYEKQNIVHLYLHNANVTRRGQAPVDFFQAPYSDTGKLEVYSDLIIKRMLPTSKSIHLGPAEIAKYLNIAPEDRVTASPATHPAVAALGYAIMVLELYSPPQDGQEQSTLDEDVDRMTGY